MERLSKGYFPDKSRISFICPKDRELETLQLLEDLGINGVTTNLTLETRVFPGNSQPVTGYEFAGTVDSLELLTLIEVLSQKKIAGHSRETQIMSFGVDSSS